ncbi:rhp14 [Nucleospora cyclopteri]
MNGKKNEKLGGFQKISITKQPQAIENEVTLPLNEVERCIYCNAADIDLEMKRAFGQPVCKSCKYTKLELITKTRCKNDYLLTEEELATFRFLNKPNPHKSSYNDMCLYKKEDIEEFSLKKYGNFEEIEKQKKERLEKRKSKKMEKIKKSVRNLKKSVVKLKSHEKHNHKFKQKGGKGICECGMEIEMDFY